MKKTILIIITLLISNFIMAQDYLTQDILTKVFHLKYGKSTGTTFLIAYKKENFFVTAKHIFPNVKNKQNIKVEIFQDSLWKNLSGKIYFDVSKDIDIVLIKPDNLPFIESGISLKDFGLILGDNGYFLGFPYGLGNLDKGNINQGFPIPLVKKAVYSGSVNENNKVIMFLDGHNNPGFSGGPVLFKDRFKGGDNKWHLMGVISAYVNQKNELITPFGKMNYTENSGIIIAYGKGHIIEIIDKIKTP